MSHPGNDHWLEARQQWLEEQSMKEEDVMEDKGGEFVYVFWNKVYLPSKLQRGAEDPSY